MNTEVDPCDNFFEFACGQWVDTHQIPEDKGAIDQMELATNKVEFDLQGNSPKYTHVWDKVNAYSRLSLNIGCLQIIQRAW